MTTRTTSPTITPLDVWRAYDGSDLLSVDPPEENETFKDYIARVGKEALLDCGDTLFAFIMFECSDGAGECEEIMHAMNVAIRDLLSVKHLAEKVSI